MGGGSSFENRKVPSPELKKPRIPENAMQPKEQLKGETLSQPNTQKEKQQLKWPLPKEEREEEFVPNNHIDKKRYSLVQDRYERGLAATRRSIKVTTINFPHAQKAETKKSDYTDSKVFNSAHVQMTLKTTTGFSSVMAPTAEMKKLLARLNVAHMESNESIQRRLEKVSKEAERVLGLIINETTDEQNRLLEYAQGIQARHEELYREWLQKYIVELDRWRSTELAKLHEKLEISKKRISDDLQKKLTIVNQEVEAAKSQIFLEEQERQAKEADHIVSDVKSISQQNKTQHIGTESNTDIYLKIRANAGNRDTDRENLKLNDPYYPYLE
ncbi:unnamed protein product [Rotaria sp. Silwood1]|nr:unnamed protein product [Rotaria sp. Silwood1]CAF1308269.1 unnamed protein product [Rotaria sp. Silwood1]CAF3466989.1 unnamed protein product [Rotaria sp. Silwood1]CAF3543261.1 unnamed protein product [Rotaria sp. Silwood1]CAF3592373.1 unnamed protein product [Rotaria sp. Silwood1]